VTKSRSRAHVSNDNPFSEAQFKTLKYGPGFPPFFASIEQGRDFCRRFLPGTTISIGMAASGYSPLATSILVLHLNASLRDASRYMQHGMSIQNASSAANRSRPSYNLPRTSIDV
jgi:hypothetical protein